MEAVVDVGVPNFALAEYPAPENYAGGGLPDVPGRREDHRLLSAVRRVASDFSRTIARMASAANAGSHQIR